MVKNGIDSNNLKKRTTLKSDKHTAGDFKSLNGDMIMS